MTVTGEHGVYRIGAKLGAGGMGVVYDGMTSNLDRRVAVNFLQTRWVEDALVRQTFTRAKNVSATGRVRLGRGTPARVRRRRPGNSHAALPTVQMPICPRL